MLNSEAEELRQLQRELAGRQQFSKMPQPIAESISVLLSRRGYAEVKTSGDRERAWTSIVGEQVAGHTRVGNLRRGVLEIIVRNSVLMQELAFKKKALLKQICSALGESKIRDLRFRVDVIDP